MPGVIMGKGYLISFVGIDGSGKTTQARRLVERLNNKGVSALYIWCRWEPLLLRYVLNRWRGNTKRNIVGADNQRKEIKGKKQRLLNNAFFRWVWILAFFIDYGLQVFIRIRTHLIRGRLIISDRIFYDSIIDQAVNLGQRKGLLLDNLNTFWMRMIFPVPGIVVYVDCPEDIAFYRTNDNLDIEYLKDRRRLYLELAGRYGWLQVDGTLPIDEVANRINKLIDGEIA